MSPLHKTPASLAASEPNHDGDDGRPAGRVRPTVVVVDDDVAVDESFGQMLQAAGYDTHTEATVAAGLAYLEHATPSVVILDLHLPDGSGAECLRQLRVWPQHRHLPVAILTGDYFLDEDLARELSTLGARVFFKPVWEDDLLRIVGQLLGGPGHGPGGATS
ncbi:MAG TPA: response regulator [Vicinamibacterales bacterium]|jgi:CheY-like chemotaxis protein